MGFLLLSAVPLMPTSGCLFMSHKGMCTPAAAHEEWEGLCSSPRRPQPGGEVSVVGVLGLQRAGGSPFLQVLWNLGLCGLYRPQPEAEASPSARARLDAHTWDAFAGSRGGEQFGVLLRSEARLQDGVLDSS